MYTDGMNHSQTLTQKNQPALSHHGGMQTRPERAAEVEPTFQLIYA